jgi:AcrR family transcriptional regulator
MLEDIRAIGRQHLEAVGAASLSVRAVARDLGVVSSAIYRYVRDRDELLTLLVVDGYDELGDAVDRAEGKVARTAYRSRFLAIGRAVRTWAVAEPATYALLFGSPVPGYHAPAEQTTGPGTRVVRSLVALWVEAHAAGAVPEHADAPLPQKLARDVGRVRREVGADVPDALVVRGMLAWAALFGCVSFELFGQYGPDTFTAPAQLFDRQLELLADQLGLSDAA